MGRISFFNFRGDMPTGFDTVPTSYKERSVYYYKRGSREYDTAVSPTVLRALIAYAGLDKRTCIAKGTRNDAIYVSRINDLSRELYKRDRQNEICSGVFVDNATGATSPFSVRSKEEEGVSGTAIVCSLLPEWLEDQEAASEYASMQGDLMAGSPADPTAFGRHLAICGDNLYRRCQGVTTYAEAGNATISAGQFPADNADIAFLSDSTVQEEVEVLYGDVELHRGIFLNIKENKPEPAPAPEPKKTRKRASKAAMSAFAYPAGTYSEDDEKLIPHLEGFIKPEWLERVENALVTTRRYKEAMSVFAFLGPAGCGKSTGTSALAEDLGMPEIKLTCHPDMDADDWFGSFNPNPRFVPGGTEPEYIFVEGPLTKALRNGWLIEIQEVGVIRRPGAVAALNAVLEAGPGKYVDLPTGQRVYRDPKTVIVFTSNPGYLGTMEMNASVLSRLSRVVRLPGATIKEMVARTMSAVPDFADKNVLERMAKTVSDAAKYMEEESMTSGIAGQRELTNWAMEVMVQMAITGDALSDHLVRKAAQETIVTKLSQSDEDIEEVTRAVIDRDWGMFN